MLFDIFQISQDHLYRDFSSPLVQNYCVDVFDISVLDRQDTKFEQSAAKVTQFLEKQTNCVSTRKRPDHRYVNLTCRARLKISLVSQVGLF